MQDKDLIWIKRFSKLSIKSICEELNVNRANLLNGRASAKNTYKVRKTIEERLKNLDNDAEFNKHIPRID